MKITLKTTGVPPDLLKHLKPLQSTALMAEIGRQLVTTAQGAFEGQQRAAAWPARKGGGSHPLLKKSGDLRKSVRVISTEPGKVSVGTDVLYAAIHQFGGQTKPHVIVARNGKALSFAGGRFKFFGIASAARGRVFAKKVNHPGSKIPARPFFPVKPGTSQLTDYAERAIGYTIKKFLKN